MQDKQPETAKTLSTAVHGLNRLAKETSPYLRQHRYNPVDWHPWGPEALSRAKAEDKPIFLSIGYSACHWCHVMEAECFENAEIAAIMNELFVNVKVDREERPDLDSIYMNAVQMMTQSGGWPMSVWLTPDLKPFYGGTYFPPDDRYLSQGRPGFPTVCRSVAKFYRERRDAVERDAETIASTIRKYASPKPDGGELSADLLDRAARKWEAEFDTRFGGMRGAPKFPPAMTIMLNLRLARRLDRASLADSCAFTLEKMQRGGIYDQIGGGFHRYSVDERWLIPHFEKMLYDNALLMPAYAEGFAATGREEFRTTVAEIFEYLRREMTAPEGGFYATQDADSEGHEGKFFVWTPAEVRDALGDADLEFALNAFGVSEQGNFEEKTSALWRPYTVDELAKQSGASTDAVAARLDSIRKRLFAERERRVKPHRDEKILTSWNGLMIAGMVKSARLARLGPEPIGHARRAAEFLLRVMKDASGRLMAVHASGQTKLMGYLDDYAFLIAGLLELAAATGERRYFDSARELQATQERHFADPDGGYYFTADDHEKLIVRSKDLQDNAIPSGNSVSVQNLLTLFEWTGDAAYRERAQRTLAAARLMMERAPMAFPMMLLGLDRFLSSPGETIVIAGEGREADALEAAAFKGFHPHRLVLRTRTGDDGVSILAGKNPVDGKAAAYVCRNFTCDRPTTDPSALA